MVNVPGLIGISVMPMELVKGGDASPTEYTEDEERMKEMRARSVVFIVFFGGHLDQGTTRALNEVSVALDAKVRVNSLMPRFSAVLRPADLRVRVSSDLLRVDFSSWSG